MFTLLNVIVMKLVKQCFLNDSITLFFLNFIIQDFLTNSCTVYHESFEVEKFRGFRAFCMSVKLKFKMVLFKYGCKRKYEGFR